MRGEERKIVENRVGGENREERRVEEVKWKISGEKVSLGNVIK